MIVYIFLIISIVFLWQFENQKNANNFTLIIFLIVLFLFFFRDYSVGVDTTGYIFEYRIGSSSDRNIDFGFANYNYLLRWWGIPQRGFLIISSFIICLPVYLYIKHIATQKMFSYLLYVTIGTFTMHLSGIRQSMAMGMVLLGYLIAIRQNKWYFKYGIAALSVFIASTLHNSAIVSYLFLPMMWLSERNFRLSKTILIVALLVPLLIPLSQIPQYLVGEFIVEKYEQYETGAQNVNVVAFFVIPYFIFLFVTFLMFKVKCPNPLIKFGYYCAIMYTLSAASSLYLPILARIGYYFCVPTLVLVADLTRSLPNFERKFVRLVVALTCIAFFLISTNGGIMKIDNYSFSLE